MPMGGSGSAAARLLVAISLHSSELELERARLDDLCSAHPTLHLRLNSFDGQSSGVGAVSRSQICVQTLLQL